MVLQSLLIQVKITIQGLVDLYGCQMRTMSLSESGDSTKEISLEELIDNFVADDFSSVISKEIGKISLFFFI